MTKVTVIGGGLAGCEAALQLAYRGVLVRLFEMRPTVATPVHTGGHLAELVCSNSLKSTNVESAAGLLKYELAAMGSYLLQAAFECRVPAGGALAVDRNLFSAYVEDLIANQPLIQVVREEITDLAALGNEPVIIATGPLCGDALAKHIAQLVGEESLAFFDAAAPIVEADSLDREKLFAQSRHDRGGGADYLNAPFDKASYEAFVEALVGAQRVVNKEFETKELFSACQPVEQIARTGKDALRYGALKPVGLTDPATGHRPWAAVQLRAENAACTAYNLVGFQTNLTFAEQERVFRMIPGLEQARFARHGVMHRNTFINAPQVLGPAFECIQKPTVRFAGQICGTEGYGEAIASGLLAAVNTFAKLNGQPPAVLPEATVLGALVAYATNPQTTHYQPMHVNFGIIPPLDTTIKNKRQRYAAFSQRARRTIDEFVKSHEQYGWRPWEGPDMVRISELDSRR